MSTQKEVLAELQRLKEKGARLITITAYNTNGRFFLVYHLDMNGKIINLSATLVGRRARTAVTIYPNSELYEREAAEMYGLNFGKKMKGLFLPEGLEPEMI